MKKVIAVVIRKGGSGKTTTTVNLAAALGQRGHKVLLIDLDPQGDAGKHSGVKVRSLEKTINTLFTTLNIAPEEAIVNTSYGYDIIPANKDLEHTDRSMRITQTGILKPIVEYLSTIYDYILIDTRPAESYLTMNALVSATHVLIPMQAEYLAMDGLLDTLRDIGDIKQGHNPQLEIIGILPTLVRPNTNLGKMIIEEVGEQYQQYILPIQIKNSVRMAEASFDGQPGILYAPDTEATKGYVQLAEMIDAR